MLEVFKAKIEKPTSYESISSQTFLVRKKHFRDTEEWKAKKKRIINKLRIMSKFNLALVLSRLPVQAQYKPQFDTG